MEHLDMHTLARLETRLGLPHGVLTKKTHDPTTELVLVRAAQAGDDEAMAALIGIQARALRKLAGVYAGTHNNLAIEDLVAEGALALLEAVHRFDPDRGVRLYTFSKFAIRQAMSDLVASGTDRTLPVPATTMRDFRKFLRDAEAEVNNVASEVVVRQSEGDVASDGSMTWRPERNRPAPTGELPETPTGAAPEWWGFEDVRTVDRAMELAAETGTMTRDVFLGIYGALERGVSMDDNGSPYYGEGVGGEFLDEGTSTYMGGGMGSLSRGDQLLGAKPPRESTPSDYEKRANARTALACLNEEERAVVGLLIYTNNPVTVREAAEHLGMSTTTVHRRKVSAVEKMKAAFPE